MSLLYLLEYATQPSFPYKLNAVLRDPRRRMALLSINRKATSIAHITPVFLSACECNAVVLSAVLYVDGDTAAHTAPPS